jgi:Icc protein
LLLDSTVAGEPGGHLSEEKLRQLNLELESLADHPVLIALHHHPLPVGSPWMDRMGLGNQKDFFDILRSSPANVRGVIFGHVHQQIDQIQHGIRCIGSPSTCVQFAPNTLTFTPDSLPPAYRWLDLHDDGSLKTNIHFVEDELSVAFG